MSSVSCKEIEHLSNNEIDEFLNSFDTVLTDCDGVLWTGSHAIDGSPQVVQAFRQLGKKVIYVTNNSTKSRNGYLKKVTELGFGGEEVSYDYSLYIDQITDLYRMLIGCIQHLDYQPYTVHFQKDIFNPAYLCALYLMQHNFSKTVYLFGSEGIVSELDLAGIKHIGFGVSLSFVSNLLVSYYHDVI